MLQLNAQVPMEPRKWPPFKIPLERLRVILEGADAVRARQASQQEGPML